MLDKNIARYDTKYFYYLLTKKFLATATKMIALEIAPNVRINGISPGSILASIDSKNPQKELETLENTGPPITFKDPGHPSSPILLVAIL